MNGPEMVRLAVKALLRNKLRSFLTALGIIIGVGAVIAMVCIGEGAKAQVQAAFASMGTNLLVIVPGSSSGGGVKGGFGSQPTLTYDDVDAIAREVRLVKGVSPVLRKTVQVVAEQQNWSTQVMGVWPDYFEIRAWAMRTGSAFGPSDLESGTKVAVLGETVVTALFGEGADPVGKVVRIAGAPFQVVGVMAGKGQSPSGQDYDDQLFIPLTTYRMKIQGGVGNYVHGMVFVGTGSSADNHKAIGEITDLLRERHHLLPGADDDFSIRDLADLAAAEEEGRRTLATLLSSIAAVSLLVGGIGIMNIMLVSVTERTREIGVRMAVGATPKDVLTQFLIEATTLSLAGGLLGVGGGLLAGRWIASLYQWPILVRPDVVALALGVAGAVGLTFGIYPARRASQLDPIEALRYE